MLALQDFLVAHQGSGTLVLDSKQLTLDQSGTDAEVFLELPRLSLRVPRVRVRHPEHPAQVYR
jgi:hypothetical protein